MCVMYVSFWVYGKGKNLWCVAMGSAVGFLF